MRALLVSRDGTGNEMPCTHRWMLGLRFPDQDTAPETSQGNGSGNHQERRPVEQLAGERGRRRDPAKGFKSVCLLCV